MNETHYPLVPIGVVHSELTNLADAPRQGNAGGCAAWLELNPEVTAGLDGIQVGDQLVLLTWLHLAQREVLKVHPRGNPAAPLRGVFATRSPHRPNPIGLHPVSVLEMAGNQLKVAPLEAIDGTPIIDLKPVLKQPGE